MLKLYHFSDAVCGQKVRLALAEKGVAWESIEVDLLNAEFLKDYVATINPNGVVPTLMVDGQPVIESNVIIEYLDDAFPEPSLRPADLLARSKMRVWMSQIDIDVHVSVNAMTFPIAFRARLAAMPKEALETYYATMPDGEKRWRRRDLIENGIHSRLYEIGVRRFLRLFKTMNTALSQTPWLAGDSYSLADVALTPYIHRADALGFDRLWPDYPKLAGWLDRVQSRKNFEEAFVKWKVPEAKMRWKANADESWSVIEKIVKSAA